MFITKEKGLETMIRSQGGKELERKAHYSKNTIPGTYREREASIYSVERNSMAPDAIEGHAHAIVLGSHQETHWCPNAMLLWGP